MNNKIIDESLIDMELFKSNEERLINIDRINIWFFAKDSDDDPEPPPPPIPPPTPIPVPSPIPTPTPPPTPQPTPVPVPTPIITPIPTSTQTAKITFVVTDSKTDLPVQGATVSVDKTRNKTDDTGTAVFTDIALGNHGYTVSKRGYKRVTGSINVTGDITVPVKLEPK